MKQKIYKAVEYSIMIALLKEPLHVRGIARILNINQMTVSRALKRLAKMNVLDFRQEGKDKRYFIKKTLEARAIVVQAEMHALVLALERHPLLRETIEKIRMRPEISLALLFGSYAKGIPEEDSDIDIYIETENRNIKEDVEKTNSRIAVKIGKYDRKNLLIREIFKHHVILKGAEEYYEKNGFFEDSPQ